MQPPQLFKSQQLLIVLLMTLMAPFLFSFSESQMYQIYRRTSTKHYLHWRANYSSSLGGRFCAPGSLLIFLLIHGGI